MKRRIVVLSVGVMLLFGFTTLTGESGFGITVQTGTLGIGAELVKSIRSDLNIRLGGNFFSYGLEETNNDIKYDATLKLLSVSLLLDWHGPPAGFFLSGGAYINSNKLEASGLSTKSYFVGTYEYAEEEIGTLNMDIDFSIVSPYLGLGWGNAIKKNSTVGFVFNLGLLYHGAPKVIMSTDSDLMQPTTEQASTVEDNIKDMQLYPVMSFGLSFSF